MLLRFIVLLLLFGNMGQGKSFAIALAEQEEPVLLQHGPPVNQGGHASCVGWAWANFLVGGSAPYTTLSGEMLYAEAKKVDGFSGVGTYDWAAGKYLLKVHLVREVHYNNVVRDGIDNLYRNEGFIVSTRWTAGMDTLNSQGIITGTGSIIGQHAVYCYGWQPDLQLVSCQNSYGATWGKNGTFRIRADVLQRLSYSVAVPSKETNTWLWRSHIWR